MPKQLLYSITKKDFEIQTFRAGGKGGQHQDKTDSAARLIHKDSSAVGVSREHRSQHANIKEAFKRLIQTDKFKIWKQKKDAEMLLGSQSIDKQVDEAMNNIAIETRESGKWTKAQK